MVRNLETKLSYFIPLIYEFEGFRSEAYICPAGYLTVGTGFRVDLYKLPKKITRQQNDELLKAEYIKLDQLINKHVKSTLTAKQMAALASFIFNVGSNAFINSTLLKEININPNSPKVGFQLARWNKANGRALPGLTRRRQAESKLWYGEAND